MGEPRTIFEKIRDAHRIAEFEGADLLHVDRVLLHERNGSRPLRRIRERGGAVLDPENVVATVDHVIDTRPGRGDATSVPGGAEFIRALRAEARMHRLRLYDLGDQQHGISHVIAPELGLALPGVTVACTDSHTSTLGGLGALGWGVGSTEIEQCLETRTILLRRARGLRINCSGALVSGVGAKDLALFVTRILEGGGALGYEVEWSGDAITEMSIDGRLTLCNQSVEMGARSALVAPDARTFTYLRGRRYAPTAQHWARALVAWSALASDEGAKFARELDVDCGAIAPQVTWGTHPAQVVAVDEPVPTPTGAASARARAYTNVDSGRALLGVPIDGAFIGSCTNARLSDLVSAASYLRGRRVAPGVRALCVPGSAQVKREAERLGLDRDFLAAGFEWREPGCSLCFYAGGETFPPGSRVASTSNRNFEGRQGPGVRTHLASPAMVAAAAVAGAFVDIREWTPLREG